MTTPASYERTQLAGVAADTCLTLGPYATLSIACLYVCHMPM